MRPKTDGKWKLPAGLGGLARLLSNSSIRRKKKELNGEKFEINLQERNLILPIVEYYLGRYYLSRVRIYWKNVFY